MILPGCCLASLLVYFAENYDHIAQFMTHYGFFNLAGTVILVVVLNSWKYATNIRKGVAHFKITDDFKQTNMQVCKII